MRVTTEKLLTNKVHGHRHLLPRLRPLSLVLLLLKLLAPSEPLVLFQLQRPTPTLLLQIPCPIRPAQPMTPMLLSLPILPTPLLSIPTPIRALPGLRLPILLNRHHLRLRPRHHRLQRLQRWGPKHLSPGHLYRPLSSMCLLPLGLQGHSARVPCEGTTDSNHPPDWATPGAHQLVKSAIAKWQFGFAGN